MKECMRKKMEELFEGEVTITKREIWLMGACCLLAGIVYGFLKAPWTHGVKIGSDNGSYCSYENKTSGKKEEKDAQNKLEACETKRGKKGCCDN